MGGKRTDICSLQKIFKKIYYAINIQNEGSKLSYIVEILKNLWFDFLLLICMLYSIIAITLINTYLLIMNLWIQQTEKGMVPSTLIKKDMKNDQLLSKSNPIDLMILISL